MDSRPLKFSIVSSIDNSRRGLYVALNRLLRYASTLPIFHSLLPLSTVASSLSTNWRNRKMCRKRRLDIVLLNQGVWVNQCVDQYSATRPFFWTNPIANSSPSHVFNSGIVSGFQSMRPSILGWFRIHWPAYVFVSVTISRRMYSVKKSMNSSTAESELQNTELTTPNAAVANGISGGFSRVVVHGFA